MSYGRRNHNDPMATTTVVTRKNSTVDNTKANRVSDPVE